MRHWRRRFLLETLILGLHLKFLGVYLKVTEPTWAFASERYTVGQSWYACGMMWGKVFRSMSATTNEPQRATEAIDTRLCSQGADNEMLWQPWYSPPPRRGLSLPLTHGCNCESLRCLGPACWRSSTLPCRPCSARRRSDFGNGPILISCHRLLIFLQFFGFFSEFLRKRTHILDRGRVVALRICERVRRISETSSRMLRSSYRHSLPVTEIWLSIRPIRFHQPVFSGMKGHLDIPPILPVWPWTILILQQFHLLTSLEIIPDPKDSSWLVCGFDGLFSPIFWWYLLMVKEPSIEAKIHEIQKKQRKHPVILLMDKILHHLGWLKPYK